MEDADENRRRRLHRAGWEFRRFSIPGVIFSEQLQSLTPETQQTLLENHGRWLRAHMEDGWEPLSPVSYEALWYVGRRALARTGYVGTDTEEACPMFVRPLAHATRTPRLSGVPADEQTLEPEPRGLLGVLRRALNVSPRVAAVSASERPDPFEYVSLDEQLWMLTEEAGRLRDAMDAERPRYYTVLITGFRYTGGLPNHDLVAAACEVLGLNADSPSGRSRASLSLSFAPPFPLPVMPYDSAEEAEAARWTLERAGATVRIEVRMQELDTDVREEREWEIRRQLPSLRGQCPSCGEKETLQAKGEYAPGRRVSGTSVIREYGYDCSYCWQYIRLRTDEPWPALDLENIDRVRKEGAERQQRAEEERLRRLRVW